MNKTAVLTVRVGHSPDSDDAFMFYALTHDKLDTDGLRFVHQLEDIETLNRRALRGELEVSAVSIHAFAHLADTYALLASGSSMGDRYGPTVITRQPMALEDLKGRTIAIPGRLTTAYLALQLCLGKDLPVTVMPFDQILLAVAEGRAEAGLVIHEGQLSYGDQGLHKVVDLGQWWFEQTGLPLPLGGNVVRKDLGDDLVRKIAGLLKQSILYALGHREEALAYALQYARDLDPALADRFVGMYVNEWTVDYGPKGREAVRTLLARAADSGLIPAPVDVQFVG
ncbi:MAG: ABC transporter substrate-binding protein [Planctomycetaceae bacterium]|nr:ABC transporter substrate-binding protein [Planctomycetaceae bacterium]MBV8265059.1 ABC transporter substrate-binding protein [Planctomycetaceae bacterium]MBV8314077.1 ABC transporter substrate-binding protein [Planctomycetaceae bacterium]MBV8382399.1 ABC transporter substrate-binding protein [Planctomycetaceae bacterium]MBV8558245.1 ABC transporter substrate-binding protein [Planctomycetaceae bacterium]